MYKIIFTLSLFLLFESCDDNGHEPLQCLEGVEDQDNDGICDDIDNCIWQYDCDDCASNCEEPVPVSYTSNIKNIFDSYCISCHGSAGGISLSDYNSIFLTGDSENSGVVAGDINQSEIWNKISTDDMPKNGPPLTADDKNLIRQWIEEGAIEK